MPDYAERPKFEAAITSTIDAAFAQARERAERGGPPNLQALQLEIENGLSADLERTFVAVYLFMMEDSVLDQAGARLARTWAKGASARIANSIAAKSAVRLSTGSLASKVFSSGRALGIGITETTRAISAAELEARRSIAGISDGRPATLPDPDAAVGGDAEPPAVSPLEIPDGLLALWFTEKDGDVCKICRPLHKKPPSFWIDVAPFGPPAHPRCRCWIVYQSLRESMDPRFSSDLRASVEAFSPFFADLGRL